MPEINSTVEPKKFPLQGIGEYFEKIGKLSHAKHTYKKILDSNASDIDKANAKISIKKVDAKMRGTEEQRVDDSIVAIPTKDLKPHPEASMEMGSQDYKRLKDDIAERGIKVPLAIDTQNQVVCGAHRLKAAKELGIVEVPCFVMGVTNPLDIKRYALADNVCRRQLSAKEKKSWVVELLRLRKEETEHIRGRKKGSPSNREIAKMVGVSSKTVDRASESASMSHFDPAVESLPSLIAKQSNAKAKSALIQREEIKESIVKGKSNLRDASFISGFFIDAKERANWIFDQLEKGEKLTIRVNFEYDEKA